MIICKVTIIIKSFIVTIKKSKQIFQMTTMSPLLIWILMMGKYLDIAEPIGILL